MFRGMKNFSHIVIGGGIAGVTVALSLKRRGQEVLLLEGSPRLGGKIQTERRDGRILEYGPNSFTNQKEEIFTLLDWLGLTPDILEASPDARHRYILRNGKRVELPSKPQAILTTRALSPIGRLRFLREALYVRKAPLGEESVWAFFARHFGHEVADYFADPFVSGIYAGDPKQISLVAAFPTMAEAEKKERSLIRYLVKGRKMEKTTPKTYQLKNGLESIFEKALNILGPETCHLSEPVLSFKKNGHSFEVVTEQGTYHADSVTCATPAYQTAAIVKKEMSHLASFLEQIDYAPVVTVHLKVCRKESFDFKGYGILIPSSEKRPILGCLWNSETFPSLFQDKQNHYLTVFLGGALNPAVTRRSEDEIKKIVKGEAFSLFNLKEAPEILAVRCHERAIPQFNLGYGNILAGIEAELQKSPGLRLVGNYISGISLAKTVAGAMGE